MTDLMKTISVAFERLGMLEETLNRLDRHSDILAAFEARFDRLEALLHELGTSLSITDRNVERLEDKVRVLQENGDGGEDLEDRVGEILDRKLDHVLEDAIDSALSGREITVTL